MEFVLKFTLNLREYPLRLIGIVLPLLQDILKFAMILVSTNPGINVILTEKLILAGIVPRFGAKLKNY